MAKRSYHQYCGVARALDVVGDRWTLLIVRDLLLGGRRYSDLLAGLPGLTTNLLAARLKQLTDGGLARKRKLPPPAAATVYELTELGYELEPVVLALGRFGARYLQEIRADDATSERWAMVSLMRRYAGMRRPLRVTWEVAGAPYALDAAEERLVVRDGDATNAELRLRCDRSTFFALISGRAALRELVDAGALELEGRRRDATAFARAIGARPGG